MRVAFTVLLIACGDKMTKTILSKGTVITAIVRCHQTIELETCLEAFVGRGGEAVKQGQHGVLGTLQPMPHLFGIEEVRAASDLPCPTLFQASFATG